MIHGGSWSDELSEVNTAYRTGKRERRHDVWGQAHAEEVSVECEMRLLINLK